MNKTQFNEALLRLGLTQGQDAKALGYTITSVNAWANGRQPVPMLVAEVLRLWIKYEAKRFRT